ncbi:hypothetical protein BAE44_0010944 [Dichanthelium oligosanthes]|uniref:F-box domain-containing protein n=1 Tax=Dichanthelium oligosanthes TaxID=888268 RepID=A0A1E5VSH6_9POAL|nr:hypothetical protein BAE44_0010944 [Dichanthelium oligosanthes]
MPYRSLCRFKCVSRSWLALCSVPCVRGRCPQTLSGFFFRTYKAHQFYIHFVNASGRCPPMEDPRLFFLPTSHRNVYFVDSCNGLLLCDRQNVVSDGQNLNPAVGSRYFVCNPATQNWIDLPNVEPMERLYPTIRLGFDPAVSSHFRVFLVVHVPDDFDLKDEVMGLQIYSAETRGWAYTQSE